jgi:tetratricopeptide (TPR) repeat protein
MAKSHADDGESGRMHAVLELRAQGATMHASGDLSSARGFFDNALALLGKPREFSEIELRVSILNQLALVRKTQAVLDESAELLRTALESCKEDFDETHPLTATTAHNLSVVMKAQGKYKDGYALAQQAVHICEARFGKKNSETAAAINNLAVLSHETGKTSQALDLAKQALTIFLSAGKHSLEVAFTLNLLGFLSRMNHRIIDAREYCERALLLSEKALGRNHVDTAMIMGNLGLVLLELDDFSGARSLLEQELEVYEHNLVPHHPAIADALYSLALLSKREGDRSAAIARAGKALTIRVNTLGPAHPDTIRIRDFHNLMTSNIQPGSR